LNGDGPHFQNYRQEMTIAFSKTLLEKINISYFDSCSVTYDEKEYILREIIATLVTIDNEEIRKNLTHLIFNLLSPIN
jgi:hypothetical protein